VAAFQLSPNDEGRHLAGTDELWGESWYHDFAAADGSYGGYARLGLYPNLGVAWYWVYLVRRGQPLVFIRDHTVACPAKDAPLDLSTDRYRASWRCTEPLRSWRVTRAIASCSSVKRPASRNWKFVARLPAEQGKNFSVGWPQLT
jgi:hypothetical protein